MSKILFLGDLFYNYENISNDIESISDFIKSNNYKCILNLEGTLFQTTQKIKKRGPHLCQNKIAIEVLKQLNVIGVCLSNNHIMDYGENGLQETIQLLEKNNIRYCGAGKNLNEALAPMYLKVENKKIEVFNYGWNVEETVYATDKQYGCSPKIEKYLIQN